MSVVRRTTMVLLAVTAAGLIAACGPQRPISASVEPSPSTAPSPAASASPAAARIEAADLLSTMVTVPAWSGPTKEIAKQCPSGRLKLSAPDYDMLETHLETVIGANLDADPATETAALLTCRYGEAYYSMVVAFDRDGTGAIVTLGKVAEGHIWSVKPADGGVTVDISDTMACCSMSKDNEFHQQRTYAWVGTGYRQTAGPATFAGKPYVTDLVLTASALEFGPVVDGRRTGTVTVKVRNAGKVASGRFDVSADLPGATTASRYFHFSDEGDTCKRTCHESLAAGATVSLKFTVSVAASDLTARTVVLFVHAYGVENPGDLDDLNYRTTARPPPYASVDLECARSPRLRVIMKEGNRHALSHARRHRYGGQRVLPRRHDVRLGGQPGPRGEHPHHPRRARRGHQFRRHRGHVLGGRIRGDRRQGAARAGATR